MSRGRGGRITTVPKKNTTQLIASPTTDREAFLAKKAEIDAVKDEELIPINVEIPYAAAIVLGVVPRIATLVPMLQRLPDYDMQPVLQIRTYAGAAVHAHLRAMGSRTEDPKLPEKLEEGAKLREGMLLSAETLVHYKLLPAERVAAIRSGTGHLDMANDLSAMAELYTEHWPALVQRTAVTIAEVERAGVLGFELQTLLGERRAESESTEPAERQRTRERAFTLFVKAYEHVRRGIRFVRAPHGDADHFAPSLYLKRRRKGASATGPEQPEVDSPDADSPEFEPLEPVVAPEPIVSPAVPITA